MIKRAKEPRTLLMLLSVATLAVGCMAAGSQATIQERIDVLLGRLSYSADDDLRRLFADLVDAVEQRTGRSFQMPGARWVTETGYAEPDFTRSPYTFDVVVNQSRCLIAMQATHELSQADVPPPESVFAEPVRAHLRLMEIQDRGSDTDRASAEYWGLTKRTNCIAYHNSANCGTKGQGGILGVRMDACGYCEGRYGLVRDPCYLNEIKLLDSR